MAEIVLQFVEGSGFGSGMIKWFGHGAYSHVDSVLPDGRLLGARNDAVGGVKPGVRIRPADYVASENVSRVVLLVGDRMRDDYYAFIDAQLGRAYNKTAILAFAFGAEWSNPEAWFCSQLVAAGLQACGYLPKLSEPANKIDPDDLRLILSALA